MSKTSSPALRIVLGLFFLVAGAAKLMAPDMTAALIGARSLAPAPGLAIAAGLMETAGGLALLAGFGVRAVAAVLLAYVVPVAVLFHFRTAGGFRAHAWDAALDAAIAVGLWHLIRTGGRVAPRVRTGIDGGTPIARHR